MRSIRYYLYDIVSIAIMLSCKWIAAVCDLVRSAMPECTPEKAVAELEHAKKSVARANGLGKASKPDTDTSFARRHVSMLRGIGFGGAALA